jgi:DNA-binding protein YbaB
MLAELFQKAQKIKAGVSGARERLALRHVEATSANGAVRVVVSCDKQIVSIDVSPEFLAGSPAEVSGAVVQASNDALKKAEAVLKEEFNKTLGEAGLSFPGLF